VVVLKEQRVVGGAIVACGHTTKELCTAQCCVEALPWSSIWVCPQRYAEDVHVFLPFAQQCKTTGKEAHTVTTDNKERKTHSG
jgi:hypothetical protein